MRCWKTKRELRWLLSLFAFSNTQKKSQEKLFSCLFSAFFLCSQNTLKILQHDYVNNSAIFFLYSNNLLLYIDFHLFYFSFSICIWLIFVYLSDFFKFSLLQKGFYNTLEIFLLVFHYWLGNNFLVLFFLFFTFSGTIFSYIAEKKLIYFLFRWEKCEAVLLRAKIIVKCHILCHNLHILVHH